jgi:hypothetical protein
MFEFAEFRPGLRVGDYLLGHSLGAGGMGSVHAALHLPTGRQVALKTTTAKTPAALECFRREIEALATLKHPGIVPIYDHGVLDDAPWYAMELIEGPTLRSYLQRGSASHATMARVRTHDAQGPATLGRSEETIVPSRVILRPLSRDDLLEVCARLFEALAAVHAQNIVHGDVKPENIFVLPGPRAILVDFGVSQRVSISREALQSVPRGIGSPAYMAPEQLEGHAIDARADLYAMGCVLYECMTGVSPFLRATEAATKMAQLRGTVKPPSACAADVPVALDRLVMRLLSKAPEDRPNYAKDALATLDSLRGAGGRILDSQRSFAAPLHSARFFGREGELRRLRERLAELPGGKSYKLCVRGEVGVGKTRLLSEVIDLAQRLGMTVACASCKDREQAATEAPLGPLKSLWQTLIAHDFPDSRYRDALQRVLEPLRAGPEPPAGSRGTQVAAPHRALIGTLADGLLEYCRSRPALLIVDDADCAEELTLAFVGEVAQRRLTSERLLLICTETLGNTRPAFAAHCDQLVLPRLTLSEVELIVRSRLAVEYASPKLIEHVYERSEGNPFLVAQHLHALLEAGILVNDRHRGWHLDPTRSLDFAGDAQTDLFRFRLRGLTPEELELSQVASVLGRVLDLTALSQVAEVTESRTLELVTRLCQRHVLEEAGSPGVYRFVHARFQSLLYQDLDRERTALLHRRAAAALADEARETPAVAETLAMHLRESGQHAAASSFFEKAAAYNRQSGRDRQALALYSSAAQEVALSDGDDAERARARFRITEQLGDTALRLRDFAAASSAYLEALALAGSDAPHLARIRRKLAGACPDNHELAATHLKSAIAALGGEARTGNKEEWLQIHLDLMFIYYWKRQPSELLALAATIESDVISYGTADQRAMFHFNVAAGLLASHRYDAGADELDHIDRAHAHFVAQGDRAKASMACFLRYLILFCRRELLQARDGFMELLALGEKSSSRTLQMRSLAYLGLVHRQLRCLEDARRVASSMLALSEEEKMPEYQAMAFANLSWLAYCDGDDADCERLAGRATAAWAVSATKSPFRWTALLPLLSALAKKSPSTENDEALKEISRELLDDSQQLLPEPLRQELERLATSSSDSATPRSIAQRVVKCAQEGGFL